MQQQVRIDRLPPLPVLGVEWQQFAVRDRPAWTRDCLPQIVAAAFRPVRQADEVLFVETAHFPRILVRYVALPDWSRDMPRPSPRWHREPRRYLPLYVSHGTEGRRACVLSVV